MGHLATGRMGTLCSGWHARNVRLLEQKPTSIKGYALSLVYVYPYSCSFDTYTTTTNHKTYILGSCFFLYAFPIIIIVGCYAGIVKAVFRHEDELRQQAKRMNVTSLRSNNSDQTGQTIPSAEIRAAKVAVINITLWIFAWTPFTVVSMVGTWLDPSFVTPIMSEVPIVCAKTSAVYNPIIYALSHPKYREVKFLCNGSNSR